MQDILEREKKEIEAQILAEIDTTEIVFMEQALKMLETKKEKDISIKEPECEPKPKDEVPIIYEKQEVNGNKIDWFDVSEEGAAAIETAQNELEVLTIQSNLNPDAPEFKDNVNQCDDAAEEFPLTEVEPLETEQVLDSTLTDIDKQNQAKYFYFYQGKN